MERLVLSLPSISSVLPSYASAIYVPEDATVDVYESIKVADKVDGTNDNGEGATFITDYHKNFTSYNTKKYIKMDAAIVSVTITWGDMIFNEVNTWQPDSHSYLRSVEHSNDDSGLVKVQNDVTSNLPVKVNIGCEIDGTEDYEASWSDSIQEKIAKDNSLTIGDILQGTLSLLVKDSLKYATANPDSTQTKSVGTVTVTLGDYRTAQVAGN